MGNLAFSTTEEQLHQAFSELGNIIKVRMVNDLETGKPRGFAFIEFEDPQAALAAIRNMNDYELNGRKIRVNFSNSSHLETLAGKLGMDMSQHTQSKKIGASTNSSGNDTGAQAVADALKSMNKGEIYDIIKKLKEIADRDLDEARKLISAHPQLPEAILHLMSRLDMIRTPVNTSVLDIPSAPVIQPLPPPAPDKSVLPPPVRPAADPRASISAPHVPPAPPAPPVPPAAPPPAAPPAPPVAPPAAPPAPPAPPSSRPADPRARADPRKQQHQQQVQPPVPAVPLPPPTGPPPPPALHLAPPPPPPTYQQQQAPPPVSTGGVQGLDPSLVAQVMGLTPQQIAQLPPDKQQSILALRQQITSSM